MKKHLILAALSAAVAYPAWAQAGVPPSRESHPEVNRSSFSPDQLEKQIDRDVRSGIISRRDGQWLRAEVVLLRNMERRYDRLSPQDRNDYLRRTDVLRRQLLAAEQHRIQPAIVAQRRRFPGEDPLFTTNRDRYARQGNHVAGSSDRSFDRLSGQTVDRGNDRGSDYYRDLDEGPHGNELRGPPPPMHDIDN